jgi:hypothetical protein
VWGWEVDRAGSGSCPMADFGISGSGSSGFATRALFNAYFLLLSNQQIIRLHGTSFSLKS